MSSVGGMVASIGWGGGEAAVGVAVKPPAALMDGPMMGSADQGQIVQVGRAAMEPVDQMVGLAPGRGPLAAGHRTAAVPHHQGGPLGGRHHPGGPADLQGLGGAATKGWGEPPGRRLEPGRQAALTIGAVLRVVGAAGAIVEADTDVGVVVVVVAVVVGGVAGDQDPGDRTVTGQPPTRLRWQRPHPTSITPQARVAAQQAVQVHGDQQLGPHPTRLGQPTTF